MNKQVQYINDQIDENNDISNKHSQNLLIDYCLILLNSSTLQVPI